MKEIEYIQMVNRTKILARNIIKNEHKKGSNWSYIVLETNFTNL